MKPALLETLGKRLFELLPAFFLSLAFPTWAWLGGRLLPPGSLAFFLLAPFVWGAVAMFVDQRLVRLRGMGPSEAEAVRFVTTARLFRAGPRAGGLWITDEAVVFSSARGRREAIPLRTLVCIRTCDLGSLSSILPFRRESFGVVLTEAHGRELRFDVPAPVAFVRALRAAVARQRGAEAP